MTSGWNVWVWLECIGVTTGCCCKGYIDFLIIILLLMPTPLELALFLQQHNYFFVHFKNVFLSF